MNNKNEILLKIGFDNIKFGMSPEDVTALLGEAQEVESLEIDDDNSTTISHYLDKDLALFFINFGFNFLYKLSICLHGI